MPHLPPIRRKVFHLPTCKEGLYLQAMPLATPPCSKQRTVYSASYLAFHLSFIRYLFSRRGIQEGRDQRPGSIILASGRATLDKTLRTMLYQIIQGIRFLA
ncbi:hypothetical protein PIIN_10701 [Serendipita indica DSM 11827]|uniref:Uncharacterized protein n=1 Tax=Serendipita indica (strain DSM 11827) TaxID=1109443 RepID=G4TZH0_SERID|nr:hypothetical protein PIIN_10701 [Serendipita indica DSM 11827]